MIYFRNFQRNLYMRLFLFLFRKDEIRLQIRIHSMFLACIVLFSF